MNLIIDIGNTRVKLAVFENTFLLKLSYSGHKQLKEHLIKLKKKFHFKNCLVSSVSNIDLPFLKNNSLFQNVNFLDHSTPVPFVNKYKTPKTLGVDRIALVSAAATKYPAENVLIIDAGTCITYDFINAKNDYLGGAISPGIGIRYKALNAYTANLPLLEQDLFQLIGADTNESIHSGVLNGVIQEIDGVISQYLTKNQTLTVVLTGGDTKFLAKKLKSTIFANPNFLLEGLNSILIHNLDE